MLLYLISLLALAPYVRPDLRIGIQRSMLTTALSPPEQLACICILAICRSSNQGNRDRRRAGNVLSVTDGVQFSNMISGFAEPCLWRVTSGSHDMSALIIEGFQLSGFEAIMAPAHILKGAVIVRRHHSYSSLKTHAPTSVT